MDVTINVTTPTDVSALATATKQDAQTTALGTLGTQTTSAAILAKLSADPATQTTLAAILAKQPTTPALEGGNLASIKADLDALNLAVATATNQATEITALGTLHTDSAAILAKLITAPATEVTAAAILAKQPAAPALESGHLATIDTSTSAGAASLVSILAKIIAAPATSALQGGGLPSALAAGGGLKVEGVAGGVAQPISAAALPLPSGASTSALQGGGLPAALAANGGLKIEGVASGVAVPISIAGTSQQTQAASVTVTQPSNFSLRTIDCTPTGALWTTSIGAAVTLTAAGTLIVPATAGQYLRSIIVENPTNAASIFYFIYHGTSPTWSVTGLTITAGTLIFAGQVGTGNSGNAILDLPGGLLVTNGVTVVIANTSGATANVSYTAPVSACWATVRYGV